MTKPNWTNRTIWTGDNFDVMRGMNSEAVDLIYSSDAAATTSTTGSAMTGNVSAFSSPSLFPDSRRKSAQPTISGVAPA